MDKMHNIDKHSGIEICGTFSFQVKNYILLSTVLHQE